MDQKFRVTFGSPNSMVQGGFTFKLKDGVVVEAGFPFDRSAIGETLASLREWAAKNGYRIEELFLQAE